MGKVRENKVLRVEAKSHSREEADRKAEAETLSLSVEALRTAPVNQKITTPEILLRVAVLGQAIKDLSRKGSDRDGARFWVMGKCTSEPGFSFQEICDCLGFDHGSVRTQLLSQAKNRRET